MSATPVPSYPLRRIYGDRFTIAPLSVLVDPQRALRVFVSQHPQLRRHSLRVAAQQPAAGPVGQGQEAAVAQGQQAVRAARYPDLSLQLHLACCPVDAQHPDLMTRVRAAAGFGRQAPGRGQALDGFSWRLTWRGGCLGLRPDRRRPPWRQQSGSALHAGRA